MIGRRKRRGPAAPGFSHSPHLVSSIEGLWECPEITTSHPSAFGSDRRAFRSWIIWMQRSSPCCPRSPRPCSTCLSGRGRLRSGCCSSPQQPEMCFAHWSPGALGGRCIGSSIGGGSPSPPDGWLVSALGSMEPAAIELGVDLKLVQVDPWADPKELLDISPLSRVPCSSTTRAALFPKAL